MLKCANGACGKHACTWGVNDKYIRAEWGWRRCGRDRFGLHLHHTPWAANSILDIWVGCLKCSLKKYGNMYTFRERQRLWSVPTLTLSSLFKYSRLAHTHTTLHLRLPGSFKAGFGYVRRKHVELSSVLVMWLSLDFGNPIVYRKMSWNVVLIPMQFSGDDGERTLFGIWTNKRWHNHRMKYIRSIRFKIQFKSKRFLEIWYYKIILIYFILLRL